MSVQHNNTELTHVRGANPEKPYAMALDYGGSMEQLEALIDGSEHCEQEVAYHCRRSRLLNTPGKPHPALLLLHRPKWGVATVEQMSLPNQEYQEKGCLSKRAL